MTHYQVNEIFTSVQGEGRLIGNPTTFIRLQGCPVGCKWCDSVRTWGPNAITDHYRLGWLRGTYDVGVRFDSSFVNQDVDKRFKEFISRVYVTEGLQPVTDSSNYDAQRGWVSFMIERFCTAFPDALKFYFHGSHRELFYQFLRLVTKQGIDAVAGELMEAHTITIQPAAGRILMDYYRPVSFHEHGWEPRVNGKSMSVAEIMSQVPDDVSWAVITGGEPIMYDLDELITALTARGISTQLETSGLNALKGKLRPTWITWSPKQNLNWDCPVELLGEVNEIKWVVDDALKMDTVLDRWDRWASRFSFWFDGNAIDSWQVAAMPMVFMAEGCPPTKDSIDRAVRMIRDLPPAMRSRSSFGARIQYYLGVQ